MMKKMINIVQPAIRAVPTSAWAVGCLQAVGRFLPAQMTRTMDIWSIVDHGESLLDTFLQCMWQLKGPQRLDAGSSCTLRTFLANLHLLQKTHGSCSSHNGQNSCHLISPREKAFRAERFSHGISYYLKHYYFNNNSFFLRCGDTCIARLLFLRTRN